MVKKRRKVWWIVGGALGFVVLYSATAFIVSWNSPEARLERALQGIIAEHGLEYDAGLLEMSIDYIGTRSIYSGEPISQEQEKQIIAQIREACPSCAVDVGTYQWDVFAIGGDIVWPDYDIYLVTPEGEPAIRNIRIIFDDKGMSRRIPISRMIVDREERQGPWSLLKILWPW